VKGVDIAGTLRDIKNKLNFQSNTLGADQKKKTDFSEMTASFKIAKGVAHNEDLSMKSPLLRVTGSGDIDIGNSMLNYTARPTVVNTTKGQGGADIDALNGLTFPVKVTGPFSAPKYGFDFAAIGTEIAKRNLLKGTKAEPLQQLLEGNKEDALKGLLDRKKKPADQPAPAPAPQEGSTTPPAEQQAAPAPAPAPTEKPKLTPEEKAKKKLNEMLGL
jgi:AsmA protein